MYHVHTKAYTQNVEHWLDEKITPMEGSVLFNDALNTFIYGYMASDIW